MSNLADLLNPAPSNAASANAGSRPTINTSGQTTHKRNESITSPLEALALAATTSPPAAGRATAASPSHPPNPYINTNPYPLKPQQSPHPLPPAARSASQPTAASPPSPHDAPSSVSTAKQAESTPAASIPAGATSSVTPPPPPPSNPPPPLQQARTESTPPVVKTEAADDPTMASAEGGTTPQVKSEEQAQIAPSRDEDTEMKEATPVAELKPPKEPKKSTAATKKGTAKAKKDTGDSASSLRKPIKKRKLEPESKDGTPFSQRSGTPNSRASKTPAFKRTPQQSPAPHATASANGDEDYEVGSDEDEVFCICRRPDDHTWMIACDGGCDDWFHGRCVQMNEADGALIDKYICPNCEKAGQGRTMWKPMCRLPGCRIPARVAGKKPSKYCSDEHGRQFMLDKAMGKSGRNNKNDEARKRRKAAKADHNGNGGGEEGALANGDDSDGDHQAHLRGGVLKPGELKALVSGVKSADEFKRLGERIITTNVSTERKSTPKTDGGGDVKMEDGEDEPEPPAPKLNFTQQEQVALDSASKQRKNLNAQLAMLADKDKLLSMVKSRHKSVLEELRKKDKTIKDICGFDSRLTLGDDEFNEWRSSEEGKAALESETLPVPPRRKPEETNGNADDDQDEIGRGVCKRKRCERHKAWAKLEQQDINLARSQCWHHMRKIDRDEEELRERALMRQRESR